MANPAMLLIGCNCLRRKRHTHDRPPDILHQIKMLALAKYMSHAYCGKTICRRRYPDGIQQVAIAVDIYGAIVIVNPSEGHTQPGQIVSQLREKR